MRVAVLGGNGQLGTDVVRAFENNGDEVLSLTHKDLEISDLDSVSSKLHELRPDIIVNTSAMHQVEHCEADPKRAFAVNAIGARNIARVAKDVDCVLVHVSTDYVFDGEKGTPYHEEDPPRPLSVYGNTKLAGEYFVRGAADRHFVLRTAAIYGKNPCRAKGGLNFVQLMLKLANERGEVSVVNGECVTPTSTMELAQQIVVLSRSECYGLYHATAEGACTWFDFAREIFATAGVKVRLSVADPSAFPAKVPRPKYSVLENRKLKLLGLNIFRPWQDGLRDYLGASVGSH